MGSYDWPLESARQPGGSEKARRNISLEFRCDFELDERGRVCLGACFGAEEVKVALNRDATAERDVKWLATRILHLHPSAILAVLNPCVVHLQLPFGSYDIIGTETFVNQISEDAKFPIIARIINEGGFWEHSFETKFVREEPDDTTAGSDYRILVKSEAYSDHGKNFVFL